MTGLDSGQPVTLEEGDFCYSSGATVLFHNTHRKSYVRHMVVDGLVTSDSATVVRFNLDKLSGNWEEEMRLLEIDMRAQMEEHTKMRVKARTLFQEVGSKQQGARRRSETEVSNTLNDDLLGITMVAAKLIP